MNRKRAAWLLAAAMAVTSIDGTVLMTSGADFTAEGTETIRDFSSDPAVDFETDENPNAKGKWYEDWLPGGKEADFCVNAFKQIYRRLTGV